MSFYLNNKGITVIQWLIFAGILGIVFAASIWLVGISRAKTRDAVRLADIKQIQAGLELFYQQHNNYPLSGEEGAPLGFASSKCLDEQGFGASCSAGAYLSYIPQAPSPADKQCSAADNMYRYFSEDGNNYLITFCLGRAVGTLPAGLRQASFAGIR